MALYLCIDLKTFFASVECVERHLDPFEVDLVVADSSRGKGALCLAISPKLKARGVKNRCRLFEIPSHIQYITAMPRMKKYLEYAAEIYRIYLKYVSKDDIHVYSIDEAFLDITPYLNLYEMHPVHLAQMILEDVLKTTGITATVGIGTNMYLAKIALDMGAKKVPSNIAFLNEELYKQRLWHYQPLHDFWQIGHGIELRLAKYGIFDMYGVAHCDEKILYKEFGVNAKYLIDHAWGIEPTTIAEIHQYQPVSKSISNGQVLFEDYTYLDAKLVVKEMVELNVLNLVSQHLVAGSIALGIRYSKDVRKSTGGVRKLSTRTSSYRILLDEFVKLYESTTSKEYPIRQISISFGDLMDEMYETYDLFSDIEDLEKERHLQQALVAIKGKYGKNSVLKGMNFMDKATSRKRNTLIGGHNAK